MHLSREKIIQICDDYLSKKIDKQHVEEFAEHVITNGEFEWDSDEVISDVLFDWDNQNMAFEINEQNMGLWRHYLLTNENLLSYYNLWDHHIEKQQEICLKYNSKWKPLNKKLIVGISDDISKDPLNALRHPLTDGTSGWYIWSGEFSESDDFFKPHCAEHLLKMRPEIIKYLALDVGYRFLIDSKGYEDVWFDENLKNF